ncbi:MAG: chromatin remodeling complex protein RSC6 [Dokdonia sp.]|jgi:chromatin remodeling complex protein RSC6
MKPQEDIGSLIKTKLQSAERASNEATWERIQHSLEQRKKKRRFAFYIQLGLVGLLLIISALFMFNYVSTSTENTIVFQKETPIETDSQEIIGIEKDKASIEAIVHSTTIPKNNDVKNLDASRNQDQETFKENTVTQISKDLDLKTKNERIEDKTEAITVAVKSKENASKISVSKEASKNSKALDTIVNRNDVPVTQTTQKIYYYYNSKNGQEMSSTDKKVIDSIVKMNQKKQDSLKANN